MLRRSSVTVVGGGGVAARCWDIRRVWWNIGAIFSLLDIGDCRGILDGGVRRFSRFGANRKVRADVVTISLGESNMCCSCFQSSVASVDASFARATFRHGGGHP